MLVRALTHSSYANANGTEHNERLEFLGDSVLDLIAAEFLMIQHPPEREGFMSHRRAEMVRTCALAQRARDLGLNDEILVVGDYLRSVGSVLADCMEAVVGALYLDSNDINEVRRLALEWGILK